MAGKLYMPVILKAKVVARLHCHFIINVPT